MAGNQPMHLTRTLNLFMSPPLISVQSRIAHALPCWFSRPLQMFGEGRHPDIDRLFETRLAPFLSQKAYNFWSTRLWYFKEGLYYQGGMVSTYDTGLIGCLSASLF